MDILRVVFLLAGIFLCFLNFYSSLFLPESHVDQLGQEMTSSWQRRNNQSVDFRPSRYGVTDLQTRTPTHQACNGYAGIYHIAMTDILGGVGTALIQLVLGQIMYAEDNNLKPWVFLGNQSEVFYDPAVHGHGGVHITALLGRNATYVAPKRQDYRSWRDYVPGPPDASAPVTKKKLYFEGTGVWEHYFPPVSDFVPGDKSCESKPYVTMDLYLITPGIHGFSNRYATRAWRYDYLPEYITQPHVPLQEWLFPQRLKAHQTLSKYIHFHPYLHEAADRANPGCSMESNPCLGLHIRHSDKAAGRRQISVPEFLPFASVFVEKGGTQIYLATDSSAVIQEIKSTWPLQVRSRIRSLGDEVTRSKNEKAVFDMAPHHRTNQEALVEILALSQCQFLVHGLSALSESSIWINTDLHYRSVNLEDPEHLDETLFGLVVKQSLVGEAPEKLPHTVQTDRWWNRLLFPKNKAISLPNDNDSCGGFNGVLHIAHVAEGAGTGHAFFISILNQLLFADHFHLKPRVQLSCGAETVYDSSSHSRQNFSVEASAYASASFTEGMWHLPTNTASIVGSQTFHAEGICDIWDSYFEPVGVGGSCPNKPLFVLLPDQISGPLETSTSWAVRAWRFDNVETSDWNPSSQTGLKDIMWPMRSKGHEIVSKYYRVRSEIAEQVEKVNPLQNKDLCLAVHIRATEKKGKYRKKITAEKYIPYMEAFARNGGNVIYVGTDSSRALKYLLKASPDLVKGMIRSQGKYVVRSSSKTVPTHVLDSHHRVNSETLVDAYAMARCHFMIHSFSTIPEAVHYINVNLHQSSINLEDPGGVTPSSFGDMVGQVAKKVRRI